MADADVIKFNCSYCAQRLGVKAKYVGKRVRCTKCRTVLAVPEKSVAASPGGAAKKRKDLKSLDRTSSLLQLGDAAQDSLPGLSGSAILKAIPSLSPHNNPWSNEESFDRVSPVGSDSSARQTAAGKKSGGQGVNAGEASVSLSEEDLLSFEEEFEDHMDSGESELDLDLDNLDEETIDTSALLGGLLEGEDDISLDDDASSGSGGKGEDIHLNSKEKDSPEDQGDGKWKSKSDQKRGGFFRKK